MAFNVIKLCIFKLFHETVGLSVKHKTMPAGFNLLEILVLL